MKKSLYLYLIQVILLYYFFKLKLLSEQIKDLKTQDFSSTVRKIVQNIGDNTSPFEGEIWLPSFRKRIPIHENSSCFLSDFTVFSNIYLFN